MEKLEKIPNKFRKVEEILGIKRSIDQLLKVKIEAIDDEMKMHQLLHTEFICDEDKLSCYRSDE